MRSFGDHQITEAVLPRLTTRAARLVGVRVRRTPRTVRVRAALVLVVVAVVLGSGVTGAHGASSNAADLFAQAKAREMKIRKDLESHAGGSAPAPLLTRLRTLTTAFEDMSRLFPRSGYSDDALWHGAMLSADAFWAFGDPGDRTRALRLFNALTSRFPSSSLIKQVGPQVARLQAAKVMRAATSPRSTAATTEPVTPTSSVTMTPASSTITSTLTSIRREVLPDAVRVTLELEREVSFRTDRVDTPARLLIDLPGARTADALKDAILTYRDDVVSQVRVARAANAQTRVLLELRDAGRYSAYALYNPYRIVIDIERSPRPSPPASPAAPRTARPSLTAREAKPAREKPLALLPSRTPVAILTALPAPPLRNSVESIAPPVVPSSGTVSLSRQLGLGVSRIVIDAGHGGHDPGAKVAGLTEADLVLDVALRLAKLLRKQDVEVVLTRTDDTFVPLEERTAIANRAGADLFLSIHANASPNPAARGIETYFLNFAPNPEAEAIAARENAASARTMHNLPDIVRAIALNNKIDESRDLATNVQTALYERLQKVNKEARSLGVKQAPFMVLIGATMPSVLAEISFLTNSDEGALLKTERYRAHIAEALFTGVMRYQSSLKRSQTVASQ